MTNAQYRLQKMEEILVGFDHLHNAGEQFFGNEAVTIEDAIALIEYRIRITTLEVEHEENI